MKISPAISRSGRDGTALNSRGSPSLIHNEIEWQREDWGCGPLWTIRDMRNCVHRCGFHTVEGKFIPNGRLYPSRWKVCEPNVARRFLKIVNAVVAERRKVFWQILCTDEKIILLSIDTVTVMQHSRT
jgi:hypothetical protein